MEHSDPNGTHREFVLYQAALRLWTMLFLASIVEKKPDYLRFLVYAEEKRFPNSNFCLRKWEKDGPYLDQNWADTDIYTRNGLKDSGSKETMQNVLAPMA